MFTSYDQEGGDSHEESNDCDNDPAHQAVAGDAGDAHTSTHGLPTLKVIQMRRVFDNIVQLVDGGEG